MKDVNEPIRQQMVERLCIGMGLQQQLVQYSTGSVPSRRRRGISSAETAAASLNLLVAFTQNLLSMSGSDAVFLALMGAAKGIGVPRKEAEKILPTLLQFQQVHSLFPQGFMP